MGKNSKISWTHHTLNIAWGCTKVSPGCDHCYAEAFAKRAGSLVWGKDEPRRTFGVKHWLEPHAWDRNAGRAGERHRVFCGSMCDVMEDRVELAPERQSLYRLIPDTLNLDWLLLTKRPQNFRKMLPPEWLERPQPNVWLMTTVERADYLWRADVLRGVPAVVRGLSLEPLLGPLPELHKHLDGIHWVIVGGESGPKARSCDLAWIRDIVSQCREAGVAVFVKQLGARSLIERERWHNDQAIRAVDEKEGPRVRLLLRDRAGADMAEWPKDLRIQEIPEARP